MKIVKHLDKHLLWYSTMSDLETTLVIYDLEYDELEKSPVMRKCLSEVLLNKVILNDEIGVLDGLRLTQNYKDIVKKETPTGNQLVLMDGGNNG
jgi:hypothetical protein